MPRLLKFDYDGSFWRFKNELDGHWREVPYDLVRRLSQLSDIRLLQRFENRKSHKQTTIQ